MPQRYGKKKRKSDEKDRDSAGERPRKKLKITEKDIQIAKKKDLETYQKQFPRIFKKIPLDGRNI